MMSEPKKSSGGIHPSAIVEDGARIAPDVTSGYSKQEFRNVNINGAIGQLCPAIGFREASPLMVTSSSTSEFLDLS